MPNARRISRCEPTVTATIYLETYTAPLPNSKKAIEPEKKVRNKKWLVANKVGQSWSLQSSVGSRDYQKVIRCFPDTFGLGWRNFL
jgi:hypothetical protein